MNDTQLGLGSSCERWGIDRIEVGKIPSVTERGASVDTGAAMALHVMR